MPVNLTLKSLFIAAPLQVLPLLDVGARMDLVDLYEAHLEARVSNKLGGQSTLTQLSDSLVNLQLTDVSDVELTLGTDSVIVVRHTVKAKDVQKTTEHRYDLDWKLIDGRVR